MPLSELPTPDRPFEPWLAGEAPEYADYWNDEEIEKGKPWYVSGDHDFPAMERYLDDVGLPADLDRALAALRERGRDLSGVGIDLAAGTLWAEPRLLGAGPVERIYALELSRHRLLKLGPVVLDHYGVPRERVVLVLGSFYDLRLPDDSVDFAFLCQAFHHAERPSDLLAEVRRVLRPGGVVVIVGEHVVRARWYLAHYAKLALGRATRRTLLPAAADVYPSDDAGDHVYTRRAYGRLFAAHGFDHVRLRRRGSMYQGYLLLG